MSISRKSEYRSELLLVLLMSNICSSHCIVHYQPSHHTSDVACVWVLTNPSDWRKKGPKYQRSLSGRCDSIFKNKLQCFFFLNTLWNIQFPAVLNIQFMQIHALMCDRSLFCLTLHDLQRGHFGLLHKHWCSDDVVHDPSGKSSILKWMRQTNKTPFRRYKASIKSQVSEHVQENFTAYPTDSSVGGSLIFSPFAANIVYT